ncbi:uncharacterized protein LOC125231287 [Leguminivora glycinivorella]|uniref:uncharacterized protein LOC125231287 n=1 Tax=Leguminivora glycinivorella TaxID=1035111 RepID=UPI00200EECE5|nr:uncharacterized protein LOC125231287 [Leguminivora glycinivorella]
MPKAEKSKMEQQVLTAFIHMYRKLPFLWKKDHEHYLNKQFRMEGYKQLLEIYRNWDEECTINMVKKKIDNLRSNYLKEHKKVIASKIGGAEVYVPSLWYYTLLTFLDSQKSDDDDDIGSLSQDPLEDDGSENANIIVKIEPYSIINQHIVPDVEPINKTEPTLRQSRKRRLHRPLDRPRTSEPARKFVTKNKNNDSWDVAYGKSIGHQVKDLSGDQLVVCQKLISDCIFLAKLNKLNEHSQVVTPDVEPQFVGHSFEINE